MRPRLPSYLVHSILLLTLASAYDPVLDLHTPSTSPASTSSVVPEEPATTSLTLWDIGFSLREQWSDLRSEEECPAPAALVPVDPGSDPGDQELLESVVASLHPPIPTTAEPTPHTSDPPATSAEEFVSFEEWKKLQETEEDITPIVEPADTSGDTGNANAAAPDTLAVTSNHSEDEVRSNDISHDQTPASPEAASKKPVADMPLHRKFNYASPDCSARVHASAPQTQHASSLLHKSKDRYMLTPCKAEHWVVIELCDSIRTTSIEVASYEFFSGIVKDVKVSISEDELDNDSEAWEEVGVFVADNVRGAQTFNMARPTAFHRFIRLDFMSFYGTEYYCPVTQLKVFGMNQMEAFRWEQKLLEADTNERDKAKIVSREKEEEERRLRETLEREAAEAQAKAEELNRESELNQLEKLLVQQARRGVQDLPDLMTEAGLLPLTTGSRFDHSSIASSSAASASSVPSSDASHASTSGTLIENGTSHTTESGNSTASATSRLTRTNTSATSQASRSGSVKTDSSESIYAFIIRRLNALEGNSSLVARYIEEQSRVMRLSLGKLERGWDDWRTSQEQEKTRGWEQERMRQEDRLGRVISSLEQQRLALEHDRQAISTQLRVLTDELGYERRRGVAQLLITLLIIVLGALTRSETINTALRPLIVEARRRRNSFARRSVYGPLTGLRIDLGKERPPAIIGQRRPSPPINLSPSPVTLSPTPTKGKGFTKNFSVSKRSGNGFNSLRQRRQPSLGLSSARPVSTDPVSGLAREKSPLSAQSSGLPDAIRPRISLPPQRTASGMPARKLARSAHLHPVQSDRRVKPAARSPDIGAIDRVSGLPNLHHNGGVHDRISRERLTLGADVPPGEEYPDWLSDGASDVASASDVEHGLDGAVTSPRSSDDPQLIAELREIWTAEDKHYIDQNQPHR